MDSIMSKKVANSEIKLKTMKPALGAGFKHL